MEDDSKNESQPSDQLISKIYTSYSTEQKDVDFIKTRLYKRRWVILITFLICATLNSYQWVQYSIINNIIMKYYNVSSVAVNATTLIFMVAYLIFMFPVCFIINKKGIRFSVCFAAIGTSLGSCIKLFSANRDGFVIGFIGQTITAVCQLILFIVPATVASKWFGPNEVGIACSAGLFGFQGGSALSFVLTPILVKNNEDLSIVGEELYRMFLLFAVTTTAIAIIIVLVFQDEPPLPPSRSSALKKNDDNEIDFFSIFKQLFTNRSYMFLLISYGINYGILCTFGALVNQLVLEYFPNGEQLAGNLGFTLEVFGIIFGLIFGRILDKTKKFKETTIVVFFMTSLAYLAFTFSLEMKMPILLYVTSAAFGACLSGSLPVGYEICSELTYPLPESSCTGLLSFLGQFLTVVFTLIFGFTITKIGVFSTNIIIATIIFFGAFLTFFIKNDYRRQTAQNTNAGFEYLRNSSERKLKNSDKY